MIELIFLFTTLILVILSAGFFLGNLIFSSSYNSFKVYELGLLGIFFYTFLSISLHIFFPLNEYINFLIALLLVCYFLFKTLQNKIFYFKKKEILIFLIALSIVIIMTIKYKPNEDYGFYHLPYIVNLINEKVIFGLANLQAQFAWNSSWLNFSSMMYFPIFNFKGTQLTNSVLFFFILLFFYKEIRENKKNYIISNIFIIFFSFYAVIKFSRISEHGFDFPANFFLILTLYYFIKIFETDIYEKLVKYFGFLMIFSLISISIKFSTFITPFLVLIAFFKIFKKKIKFKEFSKPFSFCLIFLIFWLLQQFIYSSCFVPFFEITCIKSTSWFQFGLPQALYDVTGAVNKSFNQYSGDLTKEEYIKNFNWLSTWFNRNKIEFLEHLAAFIIPIVVLILINIKNFNFKYHLRKTNFNILLLIGLIGFLGFFIWFTRSPVIRFGIPYLYVFSFFIVILLIDRIVIIKEIKFLEIIFILSIFFNVTKNLNRILYDTNQDIYFPKILKINYSKIKINEFIVNYPSPVEISSQSNLCWSIPFICHIGKGNNLEIQKKYNYLIIKANNE